jgi:hypothetical protein
MSAYFVNINKDDTISFVSAAMSRRMNRVNRNMTPGAKTITQNSSLFLALRDRRARMLESQRRRAIAKGTGTES